MSHLPNLAFPHAVFVLALASSSRHRDALTPVSFPSRTSPSRAQARPQSFTPIPTQPAEIANSYDSIAHQWLEPFLETNGIHQHEHALQFRPPGGMALDVGSGCSGRFIRLLHL